MAHAGVGAFGHLCGVLFAQEVGIKVQQVPYKGGGPALNDLVAGHADLSCLSAAIAGELIKTGKLKGFGVVVKNRFAGLPQVETLIEAGYKNLDLQFWHALFAPAATPRPVIERLNAALRQSFTQRTRARNLRQERHGALPRRGADAGGGDRNAQKRDQALGRRDPRQQYRGAAVA